MDRLICMDINFPQNYKIGTNAALTNCLTQQFKIEDFAFLLSLWNGYLSLDYINFFLQIYNTFKSSNF